MNAFQSALLFLSDHPWLFALAKGSLMLAVAGLMFACACRLRFNAAARHALLLSGCVAALVMPLLALAPAGWRVAVATPSPETQVSPSPSMNLAALPEAPAVAMSPALPEVKLEIKPELGSSAAPLAAQPVQAASKTPAASAWRMPSASRLVPWLWLGGAALVLAPLMAAYVRLLMWAARANRVTRADWLGLLAGESVRMGVRHPVALRILPNTHLPPATFGFGRFSCIVLPEAAQEWPESDLRLVFAHELAHVRRHDWLARLAGQLMLAAYWFNPLAWWTARRMGAEAEFACDERVVARGASAPAYAQCMVDMAARMSRADSGGCLAPAMPFGSFLSKRIVMVLETSKNRRSLGRASLWVWAVCAGVGAAGVGCAGVRQAQVASAAASGEKVENQGMALIAAVKAGELAQVERLLAAGAPVDEVDEFGMQAIHWAAMGDGKSEFRHCEMVRLLIHSGAKADAEICLPKEGATALFAEGTNPFHLAAQSGSTQVIERLLISGVFGGRENREGRTAIHFAAQSGHLDSIKRLAHYYKTLVAADLEGKTPLMLAQENHHAEVVAYLAAEQAKATASIQKLAPLEQLSEAIQAGDLALFKRLLASGVKADKADVYRNQPIHYAAEHGRVEMIRLLLAAGAKLDAANGQGYQPIHLAARMGRTEAVRFLLAAGVKVEALAGYGATPLEEAICAAQNNGETVKLLLAAGAKADGVSTHGDMRGARMIDLAAYACLGSRAHWSENIDILRAAGGKLSPEAEFFLAVRNGQRAACKKMLANGVKVDANPFYGAQAIHLACMYGNTDMVQFLLASGAKVDAVATEGMQPIHLAVVYGGPETVKALLAAGAKVDAELPQAQFEIKDYGRHLDASIDYSAGKKPAMGVRPLHLAIYDGRDGIKTAQILLAAGAKVNEPCGSAPDLLYPIQLAALRRGEDAANLLFGFGAKASVKDKQGRSLSVLSAGRWNPRVTAIYEKHEAQEGAGKPVTPESQLVIAAEVGDLASIKRLLAAGVKADAVDEEGVPALVGAVVEGRLEAVQTLLAAGAKVDAVTPHGYQAANRGLFGHDYQAIHYAGWVGHPEIARLLLAAGAKADAQDGAGIQPIHTAARGDSYLDLHKSRHVETIRLLLAAGAKVDAEAKDGTRPLHLAATTFQKPIVQCLVEAGATVSAKNKEGKTPLDLAKANDDRMQKEGGGAFSGYQPIFAYLTAQAAQEKR